MLRYVTGMYRNNILRRLPVEFSFLYLNYNSNFYIELYVFYSSRENCWQEISVYGRYFEKHCWDHSVKWHALINERGATPSLSSRK